MSGGGFVPPGEPAARVLCDKVGNKKVRSGLHPGAEPRARPREGRESSPSQDSLTRVLLITWFFTYHL